MSFSQAIDDTRELVKYAVPSEGVRIVQMRDNP